MSKVWTQEEVVSLIEGEMEFCIAAKRDLEATFDVGTESSLSYPEFMWNHYAGALNVLTNMLDDVKNPDKWIVVNDGATTLPADSSS